MYPKGHHYFFNFQIVESLFCFKLHFFEKETSKKTKDTFHEIKMVNRGLSIIEYLFLSL